MNRLTCIMLVTVASLLSTSCANRLESQSTTFRLETAPSGAVFLHLDSNLSLVTPCELSRDIEDSDAIQVSKPGFQTFHGQLRDIPRIARGTYRLELFPLRTR